MKRILKTLLLLLLGTPVGALAQHTSTWASSKQFSEPIYFRIGQSVIDLNFEGNRERMDALTYRLNQILSDPNYVVNKVVVTGTASPDGAEDVNDELAGLRAKRLADYLLQHTSLPLSKLEVVNGGENWEGLRIMIEESQMPYKSAMLDFMNRYPDNRDKRKNSMQYYANSTPWKWMYEHFFPALRMGAGGSQGHSELNLLSLRNWERVREVISTLPINSDTRRQMFTVLDTEADGLRRLKRLHDLCTPSIYKIFQRKLFSALLNEPSVLSVDNWSMLWEYLSLSKLPQRDQLLRIIENVPILEGREQQLLTLDGGQPYKSMLTSYFPELLAASRKERIESFSSSSGNMTLGAANWQQLAAMIEASDMQGRELVLSIIRGNSDSATRERLLRQVNNGTTYQYISEAFFPELLYGLSTASQENWAILTEELAGTILPYKDEIQYIIATTPAGQEREEAIRALDNGYSWLQLGEMLLPKLLAGTESVATGTGVSVYYQLKPAARATTVIRRKTLPVVRTQSADTQQNPTQYNSTQQNPTQYSSTQHSSTRYDSTQPAETEQSSAYFAQPKPIRVKRQFFPRVALKTDLVQWASMMPGFERGTWTPNLSLELYFARHWSVQAGYAYAAWNSLSGSKSLYSVSGANLDFRFWPGKPSLFKGLFLGVHGQYGEYDIQQLETANGNTGTFYTGGVGVGYLLPVSPHWAFELEVRGGYRSSSNDGYDIDAGHYYYNTSETLGKFVPQVRLQFMYRFGSSKK